MRKALTLLFLPLVEFLALRVYLHSFLGIQIGYVGMTDYDWVLPGMISFVVLICSLDKGGPLHLKTQTRTVILNGVCFFLFALFNFLVPDFFSTGLFAKVLWFGAAAFTLGSSFFVFLGTKDFAKHPSRRLYLPALLLAGSKIISMHLLSFLWIPMAILSGKVSFFVLSNFFSGLSFAVGKSITTYAHLHHPTFHLAIGRGCSGMEGISILGFLLLLFYIKNPARFEPRGWLLLSPASVVWMFLLNVARICIIYATSFWTIGKFGNTPGVHALHILFHNSIGWLLYAVGLYFFYKIFLADPLKSDQINRKSSLPLEA